MSIACVHVGPVIQQEGYFLKARPPDGVHEGRGALAVSNVDGRTAVEKEGHDRKVIAGQSPVKRREAVASKQVDGHSGSELCLDRGRVAASDRNVQQRVCSQGLVGAATNDLIWRSEQRQNSEHLHATPGSPP